MASQEPHDSETAGPAESDPELEWRHDAAEALRPKDAFHSTESVNQLRAKIELRRQYLARFPLSETMARRLDQQLADAQLGRDDHDAATAQLAILDRWLARMERAYAMSERIVAGRDQAANDRAVRPRPPERRLTIKCG